jgi:hypothetical protein
VVVLVAAAKGASTLGKVEELRHAEAGQGGAGGG